MSVVDTAAAFPAKTRSGPQSELRAGPQSGMAAGTGFGGTAARDRLSWAVPLFLLCVLLPVKFYAGPILLTNLRILLLVLVLPLGIGLLGGRYGRVQVVDIAVMAHLAWISIALLVRSPEAAISQVGSAGAEFIGGYLMGRAFIRSPDQFVAMIRLFALSLVLSLPLTLYELQSGDSILLRILSRLPGVFSEYTIHMEARMGLERVQMTLPHPIHFGLFSVSLLGLVFVGLGGEIPRGRRLLLTGVMMFSTFASLSSGALLPMVLQIGMVVWAWMLAAVRRRWLILFGLFLAAYMTVDLLSNRTPLQVFMSYATFSPHNAYFRSIIFEWGMMNVFGNDIQNIPPAPIFGIGMGDWVRPHWMNASSVDNYWLLQAMRYGVPGFVTIAVGYGWALWRIGTRDLGDDERLNRLRFAWMITFLALALTLCTVHIWSATYSYVFFLFGAGMWLLDAEPRDAGTDPEGGMADAGRAGTGMGAEAGGRTMRYTRFAGRDAGRPEAAAGGPGAGAGAGPEVAAGTEAGTAGGTGRRARRPSPPAGRRAADAGFSRGPARRHGWSRPRAGDPLT